MQFHSSILYAVIISSLMLPAVFTMPQGLIEDLANSTAADYDNKGQSVSDLTVVQNSTSNPGKP